MLIVNVTFATSPALSAELEQWLTHSLPSIIRAEVRAMGITVCRLLGHDAAALEKDAGALPAEGVDSVSMTVQFRTPARADAAAWLECLATKVMPLLASRWGNAVTAFPTVMEVVPMPEA